MLLHNGLHTTRVATEQLWRGAGVASLARLKRNRMAHTSTFGKAYYFQANLGRLSEANFVLAQPEEEWILHARRDERR